MTRLSLEDFDQHLENLRAQLQFLSEALEATDHNAPDWLATDLISLRNKSGRLQDDMKRFRDQLESEGLPPKKVKSSNKRLSIEGKQSSKSTPPTNTPSSQSQAVSPPVEQSPTPRAKPTQSDDTYVVQHVDVTEEVNRRLRESRLRRLMETPRTAQKRKYNAYEEPFSDSTAEAEEDVQSRSAYSGSEYERTPTKRLKSSGSFKQVGKRKDEGRIEAVDQEQNQLGDRTEFKRRKL